jgi:hypothetical protein
MPLHQPPRENSILFLYCRSGRLRMRFGVRRHTDSNVVLFGDEPVSSPGAGSNRNPSRSGASMKLNGRTSVWRDSKKQCIRCGEFKDPVLFVEPTRNTCKECRSLDRKIKQREYSKPAKSARRRLREEVLAAYGSACACCGERHEEFLAVDHIGNWGREHRKQGVPTTALYYYLKENNFPTDRFRLLCNNCNSSIGRYGYCPHNPLIRCPTGQELATAEKRRAAIAEAIIRHRKRAALSGPPSDASEGGK